MGSLTDLGSSGLVSGRSWSDPPPEPKSEALKTFIANFAESIRMIIEFSKDELHLEEEQIQLDESHFEEAVTKVE
jgi:hypothetical protein